MRNITITLIVTFIFSNSLYSQIKIWDKDLKPKKVKGVYSKLENPTYHTKDSKALVGATTVAGILIPYAIKYGNSALKKATARKEENYKSKNTSLNYQLIPYDSIKKKNVEIKSTHYFYMKGSDRLNEMSSYTFSFKKQKDILEIKLKDVVEEFSSVKVKKNYNFLMSSFKVSISAIINQEIDSVSSIRKSIAIGDVTINRINSSFGNDNGINKDINKDINNGALLLPIKTEKNKKITIDNLIVKITTNHINPYGSTNSSLNEFLEKNSETNEALLNTIFVKKVEE